MQAALLVVALAAATFAPTAPAAADDITPFASDEFGRTVTNGWGAADVGGAWTHSGTASNFSVSGGLGRIGGTVAANRASYLTAVSARDVDMTVDVSLGTPATGSGAYVSVIGRRVSNGNEYRAKLRYLPNGNVEVYLVRMLANVEATVASTTLTGAAQNPGQVLRIRFQIEGAGPATLRTKVWPAGGTEPETWTVTGTDSTPLLAAPGHVGLLLYLSSSWTGALPTLTVDHFRGGPIDDGTGPDPDPDPDPEDPEFTVDTVVAGLSNPWDMDFLPVAPHTMIYTERAGGISVWRDGAKQLLYRPGDVHVQNEGGFLGLAVDPDWATNRYLYVCMATSADIRVMRLRTNPELTAVVERTDIVTGIPRGPVGNPYWHIGCRVGIQPGTDALFITTGDSNQGTVPQSMTSLGGKTLRVTRDGAPFPGNPYITSPNATTRLIYTSGHRNPQGLMFRPGTDQVFNTEHGPAYGDEVNRLLPGSNHGWDPVPGYNQDVPMTDLTKFPDARSPLWSSGTVRTGPSGATFVTGSQWKSWEGRIAVAHLSNLAGRYASVMDVDASGDTLVGVEQALGDLDFRLRTVRQGPDGNLYLTTDRVGGPPPYPRQGMAPGSDMIIVLTPVEEPNVAPTAAFTWEADGLAVEFDGSDSTDADGEVVSWEWDFGDDETGEGVDPTHTYSAPGTYEVTLTVTDDDGATDTFTDDVTVTTPSQSLALDTFSRTVANGWGAAEFGGSWTTSGPASALSVGAGVGRMTVPPGSQYGADLLGVTSLGVDLTADVALDRLAVGGDAYMSLIGRRVSSGNDYRVKVRYMPGGVVMVLLSRTLGGTEVALAHTIVAGLGSVPGQALRVRLQVDGVSPTQLQAKFWRVGDPEPDDSQLYATDVVTPVILQSPGAVGIRTYISNGWTAGTPTISVDNVAAYADPPLPTAWFVPSATPTRIALTPTQDPSTTTAVTWRTEDGTTSGEVEFTEASDTDGDDVRTVAAQTSAPISFPGWGYSSRSHTAVLGDLQPGTAYRYRVGSGANRSDWHQFTTAGVPGTAFSILGFGDAQPIGLGENEITQTFTPIAQLAYTSTPDAALSLHAGDQINTASRDVEWAEWFRAQEPHTHGIPILATRGNHESFGDAGFVQYDRHLRYPSNGPVVDPAADPRTRFIQGLVADHVEGGAFFTDYQGVRIVSLDSNAAEAAAHLQIPPGAPPCTTTPCPTTAGVFIAMQGAWLDAVLDANPYEWSVVVFHHPVLATGAGHDNVAIRQAWLPILEANDVDLVLNGHDHNYARGHLVEHETTTPGLSTGPVYVVSVSGPKYYPLAPAGDNVWTNNGARQVTRASETSTFQRISVDGDTLHYQAVIAAKGPASSAGGAIGDVLDEFTITKSDGAKWVTEPGVDPPGPTNAAPVAAFTWDAQRLLATFDGADSSDTDGDVVSWEWDFGDGETADGVAVTHTYEAPGTYTVRLTVTDDDGDDDVVERDVRVCACWASDSFERTVATGWGSAEVGGPWSLAGIPSAFSVEGGAGRITGEPGLTRSAFLEDVAVRDVEVAVDVALDQPSTGAGASVDVIGRRQDGDDYRLRVRYRSDGTVMLSFLRTLDGVESVVSSKVVPGLVVEPGDALRLRFHVRGGSDPWLQANVWPADEPEPEGLVHAYQDKGAPTELLDAGHVGLSFEVASDWSSPQPSISVDDLDVVTATK